MPDTIMERERHSPLVLVDTANLTREEWLDWRRRGIGGSDVSAIIGISPFRTARDTYYDKLGIAAVEENEGNWVAMEMGHVSFRYAVTNKVIQASPVDGIGLPKAERPQQKTGFRTRNIDTQKTLTMEQIQVLLEKSKDTPIHMQVMFNVLMGLRRSEINGVKYSDVDYINHTLKVERQLGRVHNTAKEDFAPKTFTKQEVGLKTKSSYREIPIPDYVFDAILKERQVYEKNRNRRKEEFQDLDYICCSTYGRARSKGFHCRYYKQLLAENGLPNIRWHDLRSTYCTLLLKEAFNPKAVSKLMGHAKELITIDVYGDNKGIIADGVPEIEAYMEEVLPNLEEKESFKKELLKIVIDVTEFLPDAG